MTAVQGRVAASVSLRWGGVDTKPYSSRTAYSVNGPSTDPPSSLPMAVGVIGASIQFYMNVPMIRSPILKRVTRSPIAVTLPVPSELGIVG